MSPGSKQGSAFLLVVALAVSAGLGCTSDLATRVPLSEATAVHGDTLELLLPIREIAYDLILEAAGPDFAADIGFVADVAVLGQTVAVVDRMAAQVILMDRASGARTATLGREGEGPGEFSSPMAVASFPGGLIVWDEAGRLASFDVTSLAEVATVTRPFEGDWNEVVRRYPPNPWMEPYQHSWEDPTLRLRGHSSGGALLWVTADDRVVDSPVDPQAPPALLVRFDEALSQLDTLLVLTGAPYERLSTGGSGVRALRRPVNTIEPLYAVGGDWIAWQDAGASSIQVAPLDAMQTAFWVIDLSVERRPVTEADQMRFMELETAGYYSQGGADVRRQIDNASAAVAEANQRRMIPRYAWASETPAGVALHAVQDCLIVVGFDNETGSPQQRSSAVLVLDVGQRTPETIVEVTDEWLLREVDSEGFWISRFDEVGGVELRHAPVPMTCSR